MFLKYKIDHLSLCKTEVIDHQITAVSYIHNKFSVYVHNNSHYTHSQTAEFAKQSSCDKLINGNIL